MINSSKSGNFQENKDAIAQLYSRKAIMQKWKRKNSSLYSGKINAIS